MTCCGAPRILQDAAHETALCRGCGFRWRFDYQGKGKYKTKRKQWGPAWFCSDDYDRAWRMKNYERHEVVGTKRRGKMEYYVICCPKSGNTIPLSTDYPPKEVYCEFCDRSGELGPMLKRHQQRKGQ